MALNMSITRALAELKTLDKRINKLTTEANFVTWNVVGRNSTVNVDDAKSRFQSITDLIQRYNNIKNEIIKSNNKTTVNIAGKTYTVMEAISRKSSINYDSQILDRLKDQRRDVLDNISRHDNEVQSKLDNLLENSFKNNKDGNGETDIATITDAFLKSNKAVYIDPLGVEKVIEKLEASVELFTKEVDFTLSESNAITIITI